MTTKDAADLISKVSLGLHDVVDRIDSGSISRHEIKARLVTLLYELEVKPYEGVVQFSRSPGA